MTKEITVDSRDKDALSRLADQILATLSKEEVLLMHGGRELFDRVGWKEFLASYCGFSLDRRAINYDEKLELMDWWEISYQPEKATMYAYSKTRQPLHTDSAWFSDPPEVNFFIMEKQASAGGDLTLYPVSRLIADLQREEPGLLRDLTSAKVKFLKGDAGHFNDTEIIKLAPQPKVNWNYYRRDKSDPEISRMCEAFFQFLEQKEDSTSVDRMRAGTGDCFLFNDQRFLHGRTAFAAEKPFDRVLLISVWKMNGGSSRGPWAVPT